MPTLKDIVAEEYPFNVSDDFCGGVCGCPPHYKETDGFPDVLFDYECEMPEYCYTPYGCKKCDWCWNREAVKKVKE